MAWAYNLREAAERTETLYTQVTEAAAKVYLATHCSWIWRNFVTKVSKRVRKCTVDCYLK